MKAARSRVMRSLRHAPGFAAAAIVTLAAGMAAVITMAVVYLAVVVHPIRLSDPGRLVSLARLTRDASQVPTTLSWPRVQDMRQTAKSFAAIGAYGNESVSLSGDGAAPRDLRALRVSAGFFEALAMPAWRGRLFTAQEDEPNGPAVCVLSFETWQRVFGGRELLGQAVRLDGRATEVVGILPPRLTAPWGDREIFLPRVFEDSQLTPSLVTAGASYLSVVARLAPGRTRAQANDELAAISAAYTARYAGRSDALNVVGATPLADTVVANRRTTLTLLLGAVLIVLLVSCANAAALVLSRLISRRRDIAVRLALGATRATIVRGVLGESLTIAALAGLLGIALAQLALATIDSRLGSVLPPGAALRLDATAWAIAGAVAGVAALLVGIFPALRITRTSDAGLDTSFARGLSESAATQGMRRLLVTAEVALSAFLLVGAALFIGSLDRALRVPVGFEPDGLAAGEITLPSARYAGAERQRAFFFDVLERVQRQPRVVGAAIIFGLPFASDNYVSPYVIAGQPIPPPAERRRAGLRIVSEDYFTVMGTRLLQGRGFTAADRAGSQQVCIINASLAKRQFAARSPLGAVVLRGRDADQRFEIVGVVDDIRTNGPTNPAPDELFLPFRQVPRPNASIVIRTAARPDTIAPALQCAVFAVDPDLPVAGFAAITDQLAATLGPEQILAQLTAAFAVVALLLAGVGLYAVLAHAVAARAPEIGIRMAVGADRTAILRLVIDGALRLVVPGIAIGLLAAVGASHLVRAQLHEISPRDPFVYAGVAIGFAAIGLVASAVPALRAARVDPVITLNAS